MKNTILKLVVALLLGGSVAVTNYFYTQNQDLKKQIVELKKDPQDKAKEEAKALAEQLSKLVVLPTGEDPVVATVADKDKLKDQPLFAEAENGDKLLIYANAKKAYLFDPKNNKLKNIIPVNMGDQSQGEVAGASASAQPKAKTTKAVTPSVTNNP